MCTNYAFAVPGCSARNVKYGDKNPFWYKFTCFRGGTLSFLIAPNDQGDDYDWQLYDITGHAPEDVNTDPSLIVAANWSGTYGNTGANAAGVTYTQCASDPKDHRPSFARSPQLVQGHHYLLLVSHFTDSQSGYSLSFGGGTAVITDPTDPHLDGATARCDGAAIYIRFNKALRCNSIASNGSDFKLLSALSKVAGASSTNCQQGFDMDSLTVRLDKPLPPGEYTLAVQKGTDGNTLLDNCSRSIPEGETLKFRVEEIASTPLDSIERVGCAPKEIQVVFEGPMQCGSIAADGSDFTITGPSAVQIRGAEGKDCIGGLSSVVTLHLSEPIVHGGLYTVTLQQGSDGNTLVSECAKATPAGAQATFMASDTVSAVFQATIDYSCNLARITLQHRGGNGVNFWQWETPGGESTGPESTYQDSSFQDQPISLLVSNGVCSDTLQEAVALDQSYHLVAAFQTPAFICPEDEATFVDQSIGDVVSWNWDFGNGNSSFLKMPPRQQYPTVVRSQDFPVRLAILNTRGCRDTAVQMVKVINNCFIAVPTAFSPNGDGMNDFLYPLNAYKARDLHFRVYNRYGQLVFETRDWTQKWDGRFHGVPQPVGSYVWMLSFINTDTGEKVFKKGATLLIR
jgi:gliding motility-associated-like protein